MVGSILLGRCGAFSGLFDRELDQLGELLVMLFEQAESAQRLDAGGGLCGEREFAGGLGVFVDGDGGVGGLGCVGCGLRMVMRLGGCCQYGLTGGRESCFVPL